MKMSRYEKIVKTLCVVIASSSAFAAPYAFKITCNDPARMRHVGEETEFRIQCTDLRKAGVGGEVEVPTIDGPAKLRLAPGTPDGKLFRMRGKGAPIVNGRGAGDLIVRVAVEIPARLNARQKRALEDFRAAYDDASYPRAGAFRDRIASFLKARETLQK